MTIIAVAFIHTVRRMYKFPPNTFAISTTCTRIYNKRNRQGIYLPTCV